MSVNKYEILNPNSSGQGQSPLAEEHQYTPTAISFGYEYSHSVNVGAFSGGWMLYHCFKHVGNPDHKIGMYHESSAWETSCTSATGHKWAGKGAPELKAHLKSKSKRYGLSVAHLAS